MRIDRREFLKHAGCMATAAGLRLGLGGTTSAAEIVRAPTTTEPAFGTLAEFLEHRPLRPLPQTRAEWEHEFGVGGKVLRDRIRRSFGLNLLDDDLAKPVEIQERGAPIVPEGWHYRIRRLKLSGMQGIELPVNVYEPTRGGRPHAGGFVYVTGHTEPSKEWPEGQQLCANLAERGIVTVSLDFFGMGERNQPGNSHKVGTFSYTGLTATGLEMSDGMTAVSYLLQRGDVDPRNIGFTGWSGGGHFTQWIGVVDDRITLVVPCVGTCDYLWMWLRPASSGRDECWHMHPSGFMAYCDMGLAFASIAPRRLRVIDEDNVGGAFSCEQAQPLVARARQAYELYGVPDRCDLRCPDPIHDYSPSKQQPLYEVVNEAFFDGRHELGAEVLNTPTYLPEELRVGIDPSVTFASVFADRIRNLPPADATALPENADELRARNTLLQNRLAAVLAVDTASWKPSGEMDEEIQTVAGRTAILRRVPVEPFGDRVLAVRTWDFGSAKQPSGALVVVGRPDDRALTPLVDELSRQFRLLFIEPRDDNDAEYSNRLQCYGIFHGRPAVGMKVQDVLRAVDALLPVEENVGIVGLADEPARWNTGDAGEIALFAAVVSPRIRCATVRLSHLSYKQQALANECGSAYASVPGILELADLPQLVTAALPKRVQLLAPRGASAAAAREEYQWAWQALDAAGVADEYARQFTIHDQLNAADLVRWHREA